MKKLLLDAIIVAALYFFIVLMAYELTILFGDRCWLPRLGALIVGLSVLLEGWILYNPRRKKQSQLAHHQKQLLKFALFLSLWGTLLWAFGDFNKDLFGTPVCR